MEVDLIQVVVAVLVSSFIQSWLTVQGIKVHVEYLKQGVDRAHKRIDSIMGVTEDG